MSGSRFRWGAVAAAAALLLVPVALAAASPAQEPADPGDALRGRMFGWVEDREGTGAAGAEVVLAARPAPHWRELGEADVVRAATDLRGRFEAHLLPGRPYSAWAVLPPRREGGPQRVSAAAEGIVPGMPVRLAEERDAVRPRLHLGGAGPWLADGPLRCEVVALTAACVALPLAEDQDGGLVLPVLPGAHCLVEVRTASGLLLLQQRVSLHLRPPGGPAEPLRLPPPVEVLAVVRSIPGKGRLEGAEVSLLPPPLHGGPPCTLGTTGASGSLALRLPANLASTGTVPPGGRWRFLVHAPNHSFREVVQGALAPSREGWRPLEAWISERGSLRGRILRGDGRAAAGLRLVLRASERTVASGAAHGVDLHAETDAAGRFHLAFPQHGSGAQLLAVLTEGTAAAEGLAVAGGPPLHPLAWIGSWPPPQQGVEDLGEVRLPDLRVLDVEVRAHDGAPVDRPRILVVADGEPVGKESPLHRVLRADGDRWGRLRLVVPERRLVVWASDGAGALGYRTVDLRLGEAARPAVRVALPRPLLIEGQVVEPDGSLVAGAAVQVRPLDGPTEPQHGDVLLRMLQPLARLRAVSGPDGRFRMWVGLPEGEFVLRAQVRRERRTFFSEEEFDTRRRPPSGMRIELPALPALPTGGGGGGR